MDEEELISISASKLKSMELIIARQTALIERYQLEITAITEMINNLLGMIGKVDTINHRDFGECYNLSKE